jgi:hypothetical protein
MRSYAHTSIRVPLWSTPYHPRSTPSGTSATHDTTEYLDGLVHPLRDAAVDAAAQRAHFRAQRLHRNADKGTNYGVKGTQNADKGAKNADKNTKHADKGTKHAAKGTDWYEGISACRPA